MSTILDTVAPLSWQAKTHLVYAIGKTAPAETGLFYENETDAWAMAPAGSGLRVWQVPVAMMFNQAKEVVR